MFIVAFYSQDFGNLFMMLFTKMAAKQISMNVWEWIVPIIRVKPKLRILQEKFQHVLRVHYNFSVTEEN
jgi:hypothetical protein